MCLRSGRRILRQHRTGRLKQSRLTHHRDAEALFGQYLLGRILLLADHIGYCHDHGSRADNQRGLAIVGYSRAGGWFGADSGPFRNGVTVFLFCGHSELIADQKIFCLALGESFYMWHRDFGRAGRENHRDRAVFFDPIVRVGSLPQNSASGRGIGARGLAVMDGEACASCLFSA